MPQFNNISYDALQLQSNNLSNGFNEPNRTLSNNHANGFFSFASTNAYNNRTVYNSTCSPSAVNTPGRKSASPTFFHSNDSLYSRHLNNGLGNFLNSAQHIKHLNFDYFQNQLPFTNFNGPQLALSSQPDPALKIPTTPTRSKSLSPSHRCVNQPARLRHKQQNKNSKNHEQDQMPRINNDKSKLDDNASNNENFCFKPIESKNEKSKNSNPSGGKLASNVTETRRPKLNEKIQIKKPIPVLPTSQNAPVNALSLQSEEQNKFENHSSNSKIIVSDQISIEKDHLIKQSDNHQTNDFCEKTIQKFKLPLNVRTINLNNYPPNISPIAKRQFSVIMQRLKSENVNNPDKCIHILKQNIQFIFNKEIKQLVDQFKMSFIDPAVNNFNKNKTSSQISDNDMLVFLLSLIEDAKNQFEFDSENFESKYASNDPVKRKLGSESSEDVAGSEISDESLQKKSKCLANEICLNGDQKNDKKEVTFDVKTKFVLGKNVNDVFLQIQQQFYEVNSEDSTSSATQNDSINPKSIYSRFPNLFRYEADQQDRQWLNENQIIKRRNIKCNILLLDDIYELFKNNFKLTSNVVLNETNDDNGQESNDTQDEKDLILKKLKTFCLPEFILNKFKKKYDITTSKFI